MTDENLDRILVVLFLLSVPIYPIAIPLWILATAWSFSRSWK
jgi:hypothetical protein